MARIALNLVMSFALLSLSGCLTVVYAGGAYSGHLHRIKRTHGTIDVKGTLVDLNGGELKYPDDGVSRGDIAGQIVVVTYRGNAHFSMEDEFAGYTVQVHSRTQKAGTTFAIREERVFRVVVTFLYPFFEPRTEIFDVVPVAQNDDSRKTPAPLVIHNLRVPLKPAAANMTPANPKASH